MEEKGRGGGEESEEILKRMKQVSASPARLRRDRLRGRL